MSGNPDVVLGSVATLDVSVDPARYLATVHHIALRVAKRAPRQVELNDLVQDGMVGLCDAVRRFDPARGVTFKTFAGWRIHGEILEGMRRDDPLSKGERRKRKAFVADEQLTPRDADRYQAAAVDVYAIGWLRARLAAIEPRDQVVLTATYYEDAGDAEIARRLGISKCRVSQIRARALRRVRRAA